MTQTKPQLQTLEGFEASTGVFVLVVFDLYCPNMGFL
jgi:hypothetical protein